MAVSPSYNKRHTHEVSLTSLPTHELKNGNDNMIMRTGENPRVFKFTQRTLANKGMLGKEEIDFLRKEQLFSQYYFAGILILSRKLINIFLCF